MTSDEKKAIKKNLDIAFDYLEDDAMHTAADLIYESYEQIVSDPTYKIQTSLRESARANSDLKPKIS